MNNKTTKTTYGNLRYNDEFLTLYGIRTKRVRVCSSVLTDGAYVSFSITSVHRPQPQKVRFMKDAEVEVFVEKTEPNPTPRQKIQSMAMEFLSEGYPSQSARSLAQKIYERHKISVTNARLVPALQPLVDRGELIRRSKGNLSYYRRPLELRPGLPVMRWGSEEEGVLLGWVHQIRLLRSGLSQPVEAPIVQWTNGLKSVMTDENLEPVILSQHLHAIDIAQQRAAGLVPTGFIDIPWWLKTDLMIADRRGHKLNKEKFLELAIHLGFLKPEAERLNPPTINRCIDFLDLYHPEWRLNQTGGHNDAGRTARSMVSPSPRRMSA